MTQTPTPTPATARVRESGEGVELDIETVLAEYQAQVAALTHQLVLARAQIAQLQK